MRGKILEMLRESPGEISGEKISQELHISRAAVSKHIKALRKEGYIIDALPKRGYTFREPTTALVAQEIYHFLNEPELFDIHCNGHGRFHQSLFEKAGYGRIPSCLRLLLPKNKPEAGDVWIVNGIPHPVQASGFLYFFVQL